MSVWLHIIGVGEQGVGELPASSRALIDTAEIIIAPNRILAGLPETDAETHTWTSPLIGMVGKIGEWRGRRTVILATGDPTYYGIGNTMIRHGIALYETRMIPAPSAFSLACARLGWSQQDVETVSLHGRPACLLAPLIQPGIKILALTSGEDTVHSAANILVARGFEGSKMTVLEHMGGNKERIIEISAGDAGNHSFAPFNTLAIICVAGPRATILPHIAGLPDDAFAHDGQITKREVRAATMALLLPTPDALLWDVGAGCGSIAIEWCRAARNARAICFESSKQRCAMIADNASSLGVPHIEIVEGTAPDTLSDQPTPDAIFIGGGIANSALFETCWNALKPGGRMVVNVVTTEGEAQVMNYFNSYGGDLTRIAISRGTPLGKLTALKPLLPVTQWNITKSKIGNHYD